MIRYDVEDSSIALVGITHPDVVALLVTSNSSSKSEITAIEIKKP